MVQACKNCPWWSRWAPEPDAFDPGIKVAVLTQNSHQVALRAQQWSRPPCHRHRERTGASGDLGADSASHTSWISL